MSLDLVGRQFTDLFVKSYAGSNGKRSLWLCVCVCGKEVILDSHKLNTSHTKSCGCRRKKRNGYHSHPLYHTWMNLLARCYNEKNPSYKNYGGRGIQVCERWKNSFENFIKDIGEKPPNTSLDRIDNNGSYAPDNCRWSTKSQQVKNRRCRAENQSNLEGVWYDKNKNWWLVKFNNKEEAEAAKLYSPPE